VCKNQAKYADCSGGINLNELISIIVPVYNVEKYLARCIDSILGQTYDNLQIILVNDGSPDNSPVICEEYAKRDSRIEVINKQNGGLSDARNTGIELAQGEYIAFIDSDDYVHQRYIENMYDCIKRDNSDMCVCRYNKVEEGNENLDIILNEPESSNTYLQGLHSAEAIMKTMDTKDSEFHVVAWNKLYCIELFNYIKYPVGCLHEDEFIIHRLFASCNSISIIPDVLYFYLQRFDSITGNMFSVRRLDALDAFNDRIHFYLENKFYHLLKNTYLRYIRRYVLAYEKLPMDIEENRRRWKECTAKFREHQKTVYRHCGFKMILRFLLACISPKLYHKISGFLNPNENK
jgi:glycosyltransferase involved in cell wall biosynthesis